MKKGSPSKLSVAELAGMFKNHILPVPGPGDETLFRKRPPSSLKLQSQAHENEEAGDLASPKPPCPKVKNSSIIDKLQANLALSPTTLLPSSKSPEGKLQTTPLTPPIPCSPCSPYRPSLRPQHLSSGEEETISFDTPPDGTTLPSFNKTRARLSFKRRPPTRQHRRSAGEEPGTPTDDLSPCELLEPKENGDADQGFSTLTEESDAGQLGSQREPEAEQEDEDCEKMEAVPSEQDDRPDLDQERDGAQTTEALEEEQLASVSVQQIKDDVESEEQQDDAPKEGERDGL